MHRLEQQLVSVVRDGIAGKAMRVPEAGRPLMQAFRRLNETRSWHANGPNPISFAEIEAWCRVMRVPLQPIHIAIVRSMDVAWLDGYYTRRDQAKGDGVKTLPPISDHPLTAELFDVTVG